MIVRDSQAKIAPLPTQGMTGRGLRKHTWSALGTQCEIQFAAIDDAQANGFVAAAVDWVTAFEAKYSRFKEGSAVSKINQAAGKDWMAVDEEMERLLDLCGSLHRMTFGALDATSLPLLKLWNYKDPNPKIPSKEEVASALELVGWNKVQRKPGQVYLPRRGMGLDFGGFGKEFAVDAVAEIALKHGVFTALIDFGHDLRAVGAPTGLPCWHIGLENPDSPGSHSRSIGVRDKGIASSGDYIRGFTANNQRFGHIIDPRTGFPVSNGCRQVTVVARSCLEAGVLSTTAFILGAAEGVKFVQEFPGSEASFITERERAQTRGFYAYLVT